MNRYSLLKRASGLLLMSILPGATLIAQAGNTNVDAAVTGPIKVYLPMVSYVEAPAATGFTVNSTSDALDAKTGDGKCETVSGNGVCTLRAAIREANATPGADQIILPAGTFVLSLSGQNPDGTPNSAGGDLDLSSGTVTITGAGANATVIAAAGNLNERVLEIFSGVNVTISGVTIRDGKSLDAPGAGIYNKGTLTLQGVEIRENRAVNSPQGTNGDGGGIRNTGTLSIFNSSIIDNSAFDDGGGILNNGKMTLVNVTVSNNKVLPEASEVNPASGGGIMNQSNSTSQAVAVITNSTITSNTAVETGGGIQNGSTASLTIRNTILAGNTDRNGTGNRNCAGTLTSISAGGNIDNGTSCKLTGPNDKSGVDPMVGSLEYNGGTTLMRALQPGSPAINGGINEGCPSTDQRGAPRPAGGVCDSGSFEAQ